MEPIRSRIMLDQVVTATVRKNGYLDYEFCSSTPTSLITIRAWPLNGSPQVTLYVSTKGIHATESTSCWKLYCYAPSALQIHPLDPHFSTAGKYYLTVYPATACDSTFGLKITASQPKKIEDLIEDQPNKFTIEPESYLYFRYNVPSIANPYFIHVYATPGPDKIKLYASPYNLYPDENSYQWTSGIIKNYKSVPEMFSKESFPDLDIFILNHENQLVHLPFLNDAVDGTGPKYDKFSAAIKMDNESWKYSGKYCYISCRNISDSPLSVTLKAKHYTEIELIAPEARIRYDIFKELYTTVSGSGLSSAERKAKSLTSSEFTYGEIELLYFLPLLKLAAKGSGGIFWDLGCGTGKPLIAAALGYNNFDKICGVELLEGLCLTAQKTVAKYCDIALSKGFDKKERLDNLFKVVQGDMTEVDWSDADLVYAASICFPDVLIKALCEKGKLLKKGARIITLKNWGDKENFKVLYNLRVKMTWGKNGLFVLERI